MFKKIVAMILALVLGICTFSCSEATLTSNESASSETSDIQSTEGSQNQTPNESEGESEMISESASEKEEVNKELVMYAIGDSITYGAYKKDATDLTTGVVKPNYAEQVSQMLGVSEFVNYSISGTCISSNGGIDYLMSSSLSNRCGLLVGGDIILIAMGTNDFGCSIPLGNSSDSEDVSVYGALNISFSTIKRNNPNAKVYTLLPIPRSDITVNTLGLTLDDYRNAIEEKANEFGFNVIDGRKVNLNHKDLYEKNAYVLDGVHPMPAGHYIMAQIVYNAIVGQESFGITTDKSFAMLTVGETVKINAKVARHLSKKSVIWKSSDKSVATVKNGVVTAVSAGQAVITATVCTGETVPFICLVTYKYDQPINDTFIFNGHEATVLIPQNSNGKWIWKTEFMYAFDKSEEDLYELGYARVYYSISDKYGSPDSVRLMREFYDFLMKRYALNKKCNLFGFSRGALYAFNFALAHPDCVEKVYLDAPVLDLRSWPRTNPIYNEGYLHDQVMNEYGFKNESEFLNYSAYPVCKFKEFFDLNIPTLLIAGDSDTTVAFSENSQKMIDYCVKNGINLTYYVKVGADHHPHSFGNIEKWGVTYENSFNVYSSQIDGSSKENPKTVKSQTSIVIDFIK